MMMAGSTMDVCCEVSDSDPDYSDDGGLFSDCVDDYDTDVTGETSSDDSSNSEDSHEEWDDYKLPPPEHYAAEEANLDPSKLRERLYKDSTIYGKDRARDHWERFCEYMHRDVSHAYRTLSIQSLKAFFSWACDQRRGKDGRRRSGIKNISSLETFWKQRRIVINLVADEKKLSREKRLKATMYVEDLAEYLRVLLTTTDMHFLVGWERIQLILFCQLAGYTGHRPEALTQLRYRHLELSLVRDPASNLATLFIGLTGEFTKAYLGDKDANTFWLPEIIYDPTLVLSPHVFLLGLLFHAKAFKSPYIRCPEDLYDLGILDELNEQKIPLRDDLAENFLFCQVVREGEGVRIAHEIKATTASLRNRMKKCGEITGFEYPVGPYAFRRAAGKEWNETDVSDSLQNLMLQHQKIDMYLKYYLDRNINVDVMKTFRDSSLDHCIDESRKALLKRIFSMIQSIDPRRPWKLTPEQSKSVNEQPRILALSKRVTRLKKHVDRSAKWLGGGTGERYKQRFKMGRPGAERYRKKLNKHESTDDKHHRAVRRLRSEKQRARLQLKREMLERYREEQPLKDIAQQLSGKLIDEDVKDAMELGSRRAHSAVGVSARLDQPPRHQHQLSQKESAPHHGTSASVQWFEKSAPLRPPLIPPAGPRSDQKSASSACRILTFCLQIGSTPSRHTGDLTKHYQRRHLEKFQPMGCGICRVRLETLTALLIHAEVAHGTVTRAPKYRMPERPATHASTRVATTWSGPSQIVHNLW
ncbi:hypothetical protein BDFG_04959 [Blastomyces dermatitidis ATCC 26199]|nr:hypothetical protein BDFG_04959 [Blastomyces dermatitidis ATCC 26199]